MSPVLTKQKPDAVRSVHRVLIPVAVAVLFVAAFAALLALVEPPASVDRVTIQNRTDATVDVGVRSGESNDVLRLGGVEPGSTAVVTDVLDQGDRWVFRAERAGARIGERTYSREELTQMGWRVTIPAGWGRDAEPR